MNQKNNKEIKVCDVCIEREGCVWRNLKITQLLEQNLSISHGYCSGVCILMNGDNVDVYTVDEIVSILAAQPNFCGDLDLLRRQMKSLTYIAEQYSVDEEEIVRRKKDVLLRSLL